MSEIVYRSPGPVATAFIKSDAFVRGIRGPVGSGKTSLCIMELMRRAGQQAPGRNGFRQSRGMALRLTHNELKTTVMKSWLHWFPEAVYGKVTWTPPMRHLIRVADVELEMYFMSLDDEKELDRLGSFELTFAWINEARQFPKATIDKVTERVRRFPALVDGGPTWSGVIMDTNAPPEHHWWTILSGESPMPEWMDAEERLMLEKPDNWAFFTQAPGVLEVRDASGQLTGYEPNPEAENLSNLDPNYYRDLIRGKDSHYIRVQVMNKIGALKSGKPVHPDFKREVHVAKASLPYRPDLDLWIGIDYGRSPAIIVAQKPHGRWQVLREIIGHSTGLRAFLQRKAFPVLAEHFPMHVSSFRYLLGDQIMRGRPNHAGGTSDPAQQWAGSDLARHGGIPKVKLAGVRGFGDPSGDDMVQTDDESPALIARAMGLPVFAAPTNDVRIRLEAVDSCLRQIDEGIPYILVDPGCVRLIAGFEGSYRFAKARDGSFEEKPDKAGLFGEFSHPQDALQYLLLGGGEGNRLLRPAGANTAPVVVSRRYEPFKQRGHAAGRLGRHW